MTDNVAPCTQHPAGHQYRPGKRQVPGPDGTRYHPTVRDSWIRGLFCLCGEECPPDQEAAVRLLLAETQRQKELTFGVEAGEQMEMKL